MNKLVEWCEERVDILGKISLVLGMTMVFLAFPMQIRKSFLEQEVGLHWTLLLVPMASYMVRIPYSIGKRAWMIVIPDIIGLSMCSVLGYQYVIYNIL